MPDLIEGTSPRRIIFAVSLPHCLLSTIGLLCAVPEYEGLGEWLQEAHSKLPDDLVAELCLLFRFPGRSQRFTSELASRLPEEPYEMDFEDLMAHLQAVPAIHYQLVALRALGRGSAPHRSTHAILDLMQSPQEWAEYLRHVESSYDPQDVAELVGNRTEFKHRLLGALRRFWDEIYASQFAVSRAAMERSVAYHRTHAHSVRFSELFVAVTGRLLPDVIGEVLPGIRRVTFVPSCYVGPYVAYGHHDDHLIVYYNCRSTPAGSSLADTMVVYPPLKALADETRLQILTLLVGRELYAQKIVDCLGISQPAVSRHLNLMVSAGILRTRREGNAKYYSINRGTMSRLVEVLKSYG